jgi:hypothetical protein
MTDGYRKQAIRYWEWRRLPFNVIIFVMLLVTWPISQAFTAGIDDKIPASLTEPLVIAHVAVSFMICNVCYSIVYALEFFFCRPQPEGFWPTRGRLLVFLAGCLFVVLASRPHFSAIEQQLATFP